LKASSATSTDAAAEAGLTDSAPAGSAEGEGAVNEAEDKPKPKPKTTPKKPKKEATPRKASSGGPKAPRGRKKSVTKSEEIVSAEAAVNFPSKAEAGELTYGKDDALSAQILGISAEGYRDNSQGEKMEMGNDYKDEDEV
jgi:hypothetical protein